MAYVPPDGDTVVLNFLGPSTPPAGGSVNLEFDTVAADIRQAGVRHVARFGLAALQQTPVAKTKGSESSRFGTLSIQSDIPRIYPPSIGSTLAFGATHPVFNQFVYPTGIDFPQWPLGDGRVRLLGGYNTPPAINVILNWLDEIYSVPPASNIILDFGALGSGRILGVTLFDTSVFGTPLVQQPLSIYQPPGIAPQLAFGSHTIQLYSRQLFPSGFASSSFGVTSLVLGAAGVFPASINPPPSTGPQQDRQIPTPVIDYRVRIAAPTGIAPPVGQFPNTHNVGHEVRYIDQAGQGSNTMVFGSPAINDAVRYITPPFIFSNVFGNHVVGYPQDVQPVGWQSSVFGVIDEILVNQRRIYAHSPLQSSAIGTHAIRNEFRTIFVPFLQNGARFNFPIVTLWDRYLLHQPFMNSNSPPERFGAAYIENVDREMRTFGHQSSRFGYTWIYNNARAVAVPGFDATLWGPLTFIAYENREVGGQGWASTYFGTYTIVYNDARVLAPAGKTPSNAFGTASLINLNRTVKQIFPYQGPITGTAFVAFGVRYLNQREFNQQPPYFPHPEIRLNPHPIVPAGFNAYVPGAPDVVERFTIIRPNSTNAQLPRWFGYADIRNRNRPILMTGLDQSQYGLARVYNKVQYLEIGAGNLLRIGLHYISYRTKILVQAPMGAPPAISTIHQIRNQIPDPPHQQGAQPPSVVKGNSSTLFSLFGVPLVRYPTIFPEGWNERNFGTHIVRTNNIRPDSIFDYVLMGVPTIKGPQYIFPRIIPWPNAFEKPDSDTFPTKPRFTHHTIYAPAGDQATSQARDNHDPIGILHVIDGRHPASVVSLGLGWPWFGRPEVSNQYRTIFPRWWPSDPGDNTPWSSEVPQPKVELKRRRVYPTGILSYRSGFHVIPFTPQHINLNVMQHGIPPLVDPVGDHEVGFPPVYVTPTIAPQGSVFVQFGGTRIELFNRAISPTGIPHRGNPQLPAPWNTNPWGVPLVGYPRVYDFGGHDFTLWGTHRVEHYTREIYPVGTDMLRMNPGLLGFAHRMRVTRRNPNVGVGTATGGAGFGTPIVAHFVQSLTPVWIYYPKIGIASVSIGVFPEGWESSAFGDIDEWEAGVIKPHGDDMSFVAYPRMGRAPGSTGWDSSLYGEPRIARPIYLYGMPPIGFDGPVVTDEFGCYSRAVAVRSFNIPAVGAHEVEAA